jgi:23S rRNA pseudouridine2605 synthase
LEAAYDRDRAVSYSVAVRRRPQQRSRHRSNSASSSNAAERRVGLARAISKLGICSRSQACEWIAAGRVRLSGATVRNPEAPVRMGVDRIEIDGQPAAAKEKIYLVLNKERGVVTTASDEKGRATVYDSLPEQVAGPGARWIAPVGRLDKASEGLLLMTNDSEWAARITAPESHLDKIYHVQIADLADEKLLDALKRGVEDRGELLAAKRASVGRAGEKNSWVEIVLDEGKNRQIRRMFESLGIEVLRLIRVSIGPLSLGDLQSGETRPLTPQEKSSIDRALGRRGGAR